ncbi:transmembrane anchor protein [Rhodoferax sp. BAB1]|jgi:hypothetical protein|uniref:transmembrane anchor protein n=1 Tax=Rhodoferax sp. BAB1 TaxID=2741720 RepID=UPI00157668D8|nr:transmembrane anchor protein [Rhodoferax sp. BAB1]QKO20552.1 transmembrane anchor protein [Rhodoferax sp. BAB1]
MFNAQTPNRSEIPSSAQLVNSTILAAVAAVVILFSVVLPAEYGYDPTGFGNVLGLTKMGAIKMQLAAEAQADALKDVQAASKAVAPEPVAVSKAAPSASPVRAAPEPIISGNAEERVIALRPNQGTELKLTMTKGAKVAYAWTVSPGLVNYDMHGDTFGRSTSYKKGRSVDSDSGTLEAAFNGSHGWFWRNRTSSEVTIKLKVNGQFTDVKRVM